MIWFALFPRAHRFLWQAGHVVRIAKEDHSKSTKDWTMVSVHCPLSLIEPLKVLSYVIVSTDNIALIVFVPTLAHHPHFAKPFDGVQLVFPCLVNLTYCSECVVHTLCHVSCAHSAKCRGVCWVLPVYKQSHVVSESVVSFGSISVPSFLPFSISILVLSLSRLGRGLRYSTPVVGESLSFMALLGG